jgi:hypothetical protein
MSEPPLDDLLITPHDQIQFDRLSPGLLEQLAIQEFEPFVATTALGELAIRRADEGRPAALAILEHDWDRYLTAYALTILFSYDPDAAIDRMATRLPPCQDAVVVAAMVENVMADSTRFEDVRGTELVRLLRERVRELPAEDFSDQEERAALAAHR